MEYLSQKMAYLKGLAEGLSIGKESKEGKLLFEIVDTLGEFSEVIEEIAEDQIDLEEYVDFIDEDLAELEEDIYDIDIEDFEEDYCCEACQEDDED